MKSKRAVLSVLMVALAISLAGCAGPDAALVAAADHFANVTVGPEYEGYVDGDAGLSDTDKRVRHDNVRTFRAAIEAAKK